MLKENNFKQVAATKDNPDWYKLIARENTLYGRDDEVRSPFARDYTRILHSMAYRRLKHKTQVFFNIDNDHICTRMEHVAHVESVSSTIAQYLGLNAELTKAIAMGHDLGHAPFGHQGESVIQKLSKKYLNKDFWHEQNGLYFVDRIELLEDNYRKFRNLDLTYAVRDGIISHCGEVDENGLRPRSIFMDLKTFSHSGQFQPITWEGCIVKLADKIAYIGRDIEDAVCLGFLDDVQKNELEKMAQINDQNAINTTVIMHNLIIDVCKNSSPDKGICLSEKFSRQLNEIKKFNYEYIYKNKRLDTFKKYTELVITEIFNILLETYRWEYSWNELQKRRQFYPVLTASFEKWLARYCVSEIVPAGELRNLAIACENTKIYNRLETKKIYIQSILDYISGMTDRFALKVFNELLTY